MPSDGQAAPLGGNQMGTLLIRIRAAVALDVVRPQFAGSWRRVDFTADKRALGCQGVLQSL
jgi:hypothetical protein